LNSAINPFIYHFRSKGIAEKFRSLRSNTSVSRPATTAQSRYNSELRSRYKRTNFRNRNKCIQIKDYNAPRRKITLINSNGDIKQTLTTCHSLQLDNYSDNEVRMTRRSLSVPDKLVSPSMKSLSPNFELKVISKEENFQCLSVTESDDI